MADPKAEQLLPEKGRVNRVRQEWLVHEDGVLAHNLQEKEFGDKYDWNREDRRTARTDVPLAKFVQTKEEMDQQRERLEKLEQQRLIAEKDAEIAEQVQKLEKEKKKLPERRAKDDSIIAQQYQQEELIRVERERIRQELRDEEYARLLQTKEQRYAERKQKQRELAHEKKLLEQEQQMHAQRLLPGYNKGTPSPREGATGQVSPRDRTPPLNVQQGMADLSLGNEQPPKVLRSDGRIEDAGDFSDFYIQPNTTMALSERKELQELQDEELARLLQDQERKRGAQINKGALKQLEARDAEIARIMQEQEKLKAKKKKVPTATLR